MAKDKKQTSNDGSNPATEAYIADTLTAAEAGDSAAAAEVLSLFREAVDAGNIGGISAIYRKLAEYVAERFWNLETTAASLDVVFGTIVKRGRGQPKGNTKVGATSYAALMVLLSQRLGSANEAKAKIIELESNAAGKSTVSKRWLDSIYTTHAPMRSLAHDDLVVFLTPAHRNLFRRTLR